jgi:hypothetical protein
MTIPIQKNVRQVMALLSGLSLFENRVYSCTLLETLGMTKSTIDEIRELEASIEGSMRKAFSSRAFSRSFLLCSLCDLYAKLHTLQLR